MFVRSCKRKYPRVTPGFGYLDPTFVDIFEVETENRVCFIFENRDCQRFFGLRFHTFPRYKRDANTLKALRVQLFALKKMELYTQTCLPFNYFHTHML